MSVFDEAARKYPVPALITVASPASKSGTAPAAAPAALNTGRLRVGIAVHLGVALSAVAILAAAANLIVERGVAIVRTTNTEPGISAPTVITVSAPPTPTVVQNEPAPQPAPRSINPDPLISSLDRFDRAVQGRVDANADDTVSQLQRASKSLDRETDEFGRQAAGVIEPARLSKLAAGIKDYKKSGNELIDLSDARRKLLNDYSERFEAMNSRRKDALDHAWKVFGRVVARQYLIELGANLDDIRRRFAVLTVPGGYDGSAIDSLAASEAALAATLRDNEKGLVGSEGRPWLDAMHSDLEQLIALRSSLWTLDGQRHSATVAFSQASISLTIQARHKPRLVTDAKAKAAVAVPTASVAVTPMVSAASTTSAPPASPPTVSQERSVTTTSYVQQDKKRRVLIAWISLAVLVLLIVIGVATVMSIVRPVRRMLRATVRLANGDLDVKVPRGGIKELDTLAVAFNQMAGQIAAARNVARGYQQELEGKVDERTRQLQDLAENDPLTLLPNRRQLFVLLNASIERAARNGHYAGVFFIDLDNFKNINDGMGHAFGDRVLISIAQRLREIAGDFGFAARLGGDEFTVVYDDAESVEDVRNAGWELVRAFQRPLNIEGRDLMVSVSVGVSLFPDHERDAEALLRAADAALFRAKALGRSQLTVFTPELLEAASAKFTTEQGLRRAVERGEFELVFQPEVSLDTLQTGLVEALLRWRLPDGRYAAPGEFLAVAEESGLIMEISDWVLRSAIDTASRWHHGTWPEARVAINVSPRQLFDSRFVERVQQLLTEYNLPPRCIEIELTETVLQTGPATIDTLRRLRAHGVAIALDDFGTGYSSLSSLEQLPLTRIKLDRSLIASIDTSPRSAAIARAIISLCHSLGLEITAEGIERPEQLALLLRERPMYLQGYLLSRPVSAEELMPTMANLGERMQGLLAGCGGTSSKPMEELSPLQAETLLSA